MTRARAEEVIDQNLYYDDPQLKRTVHDRKVAVFAHAATMLSPPLQPVSIPFDGIEMPGYLRLPEDAKAGAQDGSKPPPCVILLGGLDTTKEDYLVVNDLCVERGLATLAFDGPGQGETLFRMPWRRDFEQSVIAVLDFLEQCPQIDAGRIGIIGRSTGGYYAPKAASMDTRIRAAVAWGAMYHLRNLASIRVDGVRSCLLHERSDCLRRTWQKARPCNLLLVTDNSGRRTLSFWLTPRRLKMPGSGISRVELTNVSSHGLWLLVDDEEFSLPFDQFPWFRGATIEQLSAIERPVPDHLHWPLLDVDLALQSIRDPSGWPLVAREA